MLGGAASFSDETVYGASFPAVYAMMARNHMNRYGTTREDLAAIAVKNHAAGALNPKAHFQHAITTSDVLAAPAVASPLGLLDCSPISDGAAAVVLSSRPGTRSDARIISSHVAHDTMSVHDRDDLSSLASTRRAAAAAYASAGIGPGDISLAEVHDCFTIAELMAYEDLGFAQRGQGGKFASQPSFNINTSGGLKACGHPVGATGVKQIVELALQFTGRAGKRQVTSPLRYGLAQNVGGSGATAVVTVVAHA
jgi:acetyl-CoA C-acetyltransferase